MKTVDLVVTGDETAAVGAAVDAVRRGQRVLVVLRAAGSRIVPRVRRLCRPAKHQLTVITNAEVVCVDGVHGVEAVVLRYTRTGRLCAVNASAFVSCNRSTHPPRARIGDMPVENRKIHAERGDSVETGLDSVERKSKSVSIVTGRVPSRGCPFDQQ
jgi:thioredoxin reductase